MKKRKWFVSVRSRMLLTYLIVGTIPLAFLGWLTFSQYATGIQREIVQNLNNTNHELVHNLEKRMDGYHGMLSQVMFDPNVQKIFRTDDPQEQQNLAMEYLAPQIRRISSLDLIMQDMAIYAENFSSTSGFLRSSQMVRSEKFYRLAMEQGSSICLEGDSILYSRSFTPLMPAEQQAPRVIITLRLDRDLFFYDMNTRQNQTGILIREPSGETVNYRDFRTPYHFRGQQALLLEREGKGELTIDGETFYYVEELLPEGPWRVASFAPRQEILYLTNLWFLVLMGLLLLTVIVILSAVFSRRITSPLVFMVHKMKELEAGNYDVRFETSSHDEIGDLEESFNHMASELQKMIEIELQQEITIRDNQLETLYAQISPHFLYNTLYAINMKAIMLNAPEISALVTALSTFYRTALNRGRPTIAISGELQNLRAYMEIQNALHGDSFRVEYEVDEAILQYGIANFVLQPMAENAIEHGVEMIDDPGLIVVTGSIEAGEIHLAIEDNGPGFGNQPDSHMKTSGYGIYNVDTRIKLMFGPEYGLRFSASRFHGAKSEIVIPAQLFHGS